MVLGVLILKHIIELYVSECKFDSSIEFKENISKPHNNADKWSII